MATSYAIDALDDLIREELPTLIHESLPEIAPTFKYIQNTSMGVVRKGIGRDWEVEHLFSTGVAGLIQSADVRGPTFYDRVGANNPFYQSLVMDGSNLAIFPTAVNAPHTSSLKRILTLQMTTGNFSVPVTWLSGDALGASQIKQVARDIKAVGQLRALNEATSFFMGAQNALCQIDDYALDGSSKFITFTVKEGTGRTAFFRIGMMVDFYYDNSGEPNWGSTGGTHYANCDGTGAPWSSSYIPIIISDVDYLSGTITATSIDGTQIDGGTLQGDAIADDDWVVMANCGTTDGREMRSWGLEDWMANSGQILGGSATVGNRLNPALDLDTQSQFKSQLVTVSAPLTDEIMNAYIGGFLDAYPGQSLDSIITTMGVTLKYIEQPSNYNNRMFYDRTGKPLNVSGGWSDVSYQFNGRAMRWIISPLCISGRLYALKLNNKNISRYVPPSVSRGDGRVSGAVEFLAPLGGSTSIFKIAHDGDGASQAVLEAPFWEYHLVAPVDVKGVKLSSLTETTMV